MKQVCKNTYQIEDIPALRRKRVWRRFNAHVAQLRIFRVPTEFDWTPEIWQLGDEEADPVNLSDEGDESSEPTELAVPVNPEEREEVPTQLPQSIGDDQAPIQVSRSGRTIHTPSHLQQFILD